MSESPEYIARAKTALSWTLATANVSDETRAAFADTFADDAELMFQFALTRYTVLGWDLETTLLKWSQQWSPEIRERWWADVLAQRDVWIASIAPVGAKGN